MCFRRPDAVAPELSREFSLSKADVGVLSGAHPAGAASSARSAAHG